MSGPIVRTGTTPEFWKNYDAIFGGKKKAAAPKKAAAKVAAKPAAKPAKKAAKKAAKKK
ncbi:MAG: RNA polymerase subunit sigma [Planctomycetota bacterium]